MNIDHAATLLKYCAADDCRTISPLDITWWADALGDVQLGQAVEGLKRFRRATPDKRVTPWHILNEVRALRTERIQHGDQIDQLVPNVDPDDHQSWIAEIRAIRAAAGSDALDVQDYRDSGRTLTGAHAVKAIGPAGPAVTDYASFRALFPRNAAQQRDRERTEVERRALERKRADELAALEAKYDLASSRP